LGLIVVMFCLRKLEFFDFNLMKSLKPFDDSSKEEFFRFLPLVKESKLRDCQF